MRIHFRISERWIDGEKVEIPLLKLVACIGDDWMNQNIKGFLKILLRYGARGYGEKHIGVRREFALGTRSFNSQQVAEMLDILAKQKIISEQDGWYVFYLRRVQFLPY